MPTTRPHSTANEALLDSALRRAINLEGLKNGEAQKLNSYLSNVLFPRITREVRDGATKAAGLTATSGFLSPERSALREMDAAIGEHLKAIPGTVGKRTEASALRVAQDEARYQAEALKDAVPLDLAFKQPSLQTLKAMVHSSPVQGKVMGKWWGELAEGTRQKITQQVNQGLINGESVQGIVRRIRGTKANGFKDGVLGTTRRQAEGLVRTQMTHVSAQAREMTAKANEDVVKGVQIVATLDARTCFSYNTPVVQANGATRPIGEIRPGDRVVSGQGSIRRVVASTSSPASEWLEFRTKCGLAFKCTQNHPFWTLNGWTEAWALSEGARIGTRAEGLQEMQPGFQPQGQRATVLQRPLPGRGLSVKPPRAGLPWVLFNVYRAQRLPSTEVLLQAMLLAISKEKAPALSALWGEHTNPHLRIESLLLPDVLPRIGRCGLLGSGVPAVWEGLSGEKGLCRSKRGRWHALQPDLLQLEPKDGVECVRFGLKLRDLWNGILVPALFALARDRAEALLHQVPEAYRSSRMRNVLEAVREEGLEEVEVLLHCLLSIEQPANIPRGNGLPGAGETRVVVRPGGSDRPLEHRFRGRGSEVGNRGRRGVLASRHKEARSEEVGSHSGCRVESDSYCRGRGLRSGEGGSLKGDLALPTGWAVVDSIRWSFSEEPCFDIEVEDDHSFLIDGGVIAHNSDICISLDGQVFEIDRGPRPAFHHQCRTTTVLVTKSWKELGIPLQETTPEFRASMNGVVPAELNYSQWLRQQPKAFQDSVLGPTKAAMFRGNRLKLDRLVTRDLKPRTIAELRAMKPGQEVTFPGLLKTKKRKVLPTGEVRMTSTERKAIKDWKGHVCPRSPSHTARSSSDWTQNLSRRDRRALRSWQRHTCK